ncbi:GIY-YIG nuclease family protein [Clostridium beijerinckii]|uniref:GIY-YIG nuclease family protein n=1 Tax=Clostridium beijerinckii TaxID=1520 RepID=UPI00047B78B3|nr:GIY-YIG nuclease family protein [Clostridium beijerinckii]
MKWYLYRFLNIKNNIIYIGKTGNIAQRLAYHFGTRGHLPIECYNETNKIEILELNTKTEMNIKELYYISKYKCKYNICDNNEVVYIKGLEDNDIWKEYNIKKEESESKDEKIKKLLIENKELRIKLKEQHKKNIEELKKAYAIFNEYYVLKEVIEEYEKVTGLTWKKKAYNIVIS